MFIYETVTSEVRKAMVEDINCIDVFAIGNCIYGIFYTPIKESMKLLIDCLAKVHSTLILFTNISKLENLNYKIIVDYGDVYFVNYEKNINNNYHWFGNIFDVLLDNSGEASEKYGIYSIPTTYFIDKNGNIVNHTVGVMEEEVLNEKLDLIR